MPRPEWLKYPLLRIRIWDSAHEILGLLDVVGSSNDTKSGGSSSTVMQATCIVRASKDETKGAWLLEAPTEEETIAGLH